MALPNYGIPDQDASIGSVADMVKQGGLMLSVIAQNALRPAAEIITDNQQHLDTVHQAIRRKLLGIVKASDNKLNKVRDALNADLTMRYVAVGHNLNIGLQSEQPRVIERDQFKLYTVGPDGGHACGFICLPFYSPAPQSPYKLAGTFPTRQACDAAGRQWLATCRTAYARKGQVPGPGLTGDVGNFTGVTPTTPSQSASGSCTVEDSWSKNTQPVDWPTDANANPIATVVLPDAIAAVGQPNPVSNARPSEGSFISGWNQAEGDIGGWIQLQSIRPLVSSITGCLYSFTCTPFTGGPFFQCCKLRYETPSASITQPPICDPATDPSCAPPPPPPPSDCSWYCVNFGTDAKPDTRCLYSTADSISAACLTITGGPYDNELDCIHNCRVCNQQSTITPPDQTPPDQIPPPSNQPPLSPPDLTMPVCGDNADPTMVRIGSVQWCSCLESIKSALQIVAENSVTWIDDPPQFSSPDWSSWIGQVISAVIPGADLMKAGVDFALGVYNSVAASVQTALSSIKAVMIVAVPCDPKMYYNLVILRCIVTSLEKFRVGTDALIWGTVDIGIELKKVKQLLDYLENSICPMEIPGIGESIDCTLQHTAPTEQINCWMNAKGYDAEVWQPVLDARREKLFTPELIQWYRRNGADDPAIVDALQRQGWYRQDEAQARVNLYDQLPTISDQLHFIQRNVYDSAYVNDYGLMEDFYPRLWDVAGPQLRAIGVTENVAGLHYAAHWINPAPGQMQEMVFRLRPDKQGVQNPFTVDDYQRILVEQDVAPYFRKRFAEIVHNVPALGYLRDMYRQYIISDDELVSYHQDLGYTKDDSDRFLQIDSIMRNRIRAAQGHGWVPPALAKAYISGYIDKQQVYNEMDTLGYTAEEADKLMRRSESDLQYTVISRARGRVTFALLTQVRQAIDAGTMTTDDATMALTNMGWPPDFATGWVGMQQTAANVKLVKQATQRVRSAFLAGEIDLPYVQSALSTLGINQDAITNITTAWQIEQTPNRKRRAAQSIVMDVVAGAMTTVEAIARLENLGYEDADRQLFMADAQRKILEREIETDAASVLDNPSTANAITGMLQTAGIQTDRLRHALKRLSPPSKMQKWAELGLISENLFKYRLHIMGFPDSDIGRWWEEALAKQAKKSTTGTSKQNRSGTSGNGQAHITPGSA